jgi:hypothetical protein
MTATAYRPSPGVTFPLVTLVSSSSVSGSVNCEGQTVIEVPPELFEHLWRYAEAGISGSFTQPTSPDIQRATERANLLASD